ncbi:hypothetical protein DY000_02054083 [Brassica cretica]|uniref:Uncharacterized protein n=1 Tax=Brassica cretica TaxID=69181 RepID=A0ABQ7ALS0_BRACR|nr:hypothetical protein DY000_02054083 [Brassica cretica]
MGDSSVHITEGSETRVSRRPIETPEDGFKFEFNRGLPLACYPEDCARLLRSVKGGPDQLPPVGDLLFKDEYEHAACSSVKSQGDWNVLVEKYDTALRRTREQVRTQKGTSGGKVGSSGPETTDAVPVTAEQAPTGGSSQGKNLKKKKRNTEARKEPNEVERTDMGGSSKKDGKKRKAGDPPAEDAPKKKKMRKKDFSLLRPSSVCEEELQALVPDATPEAGTLDDDENETIALRRRRREGRTTGGGSGGVSTGDRGVSEVPRKLPASGGQQGRLMGDSSVHITEGSETRVSGRPNETPEYGFKFEFNRGLSLACYPEDCARLLRSVKGGPDQLPPVGDLLFKDEYEHAACSSVKSQGDWNVLVEKYDTALRRTREQTTNAVPVAAEQAPTGGSSQGKNLKKKKRKTEARKEPNEVERTDIGGPSKKDGKKRKAGDPPAEDVPKKKKMRKKDFSLPRPSSVCEEELQALVPDATPEAGTSDDDDENETIALRRRRREDRTAGGGSGGVLMGDRGVSEVPKKLPASGGQQGRLMGDSSVHITEGSETRVSGCPIETPEDGFKFEFNRGLPLACYPEDCARLLRSVKGGPD